MPVARTSKPIRPRAAPSDAKKRTGRRRPNLDCMCGDEKLESPRARGGGEPPQDTNWAVRL